MTKRPKKAFTMGGGPVWYFNLQFIQISNNCDERTMEMELYGIKVPEEF